MEVSLVRGAPVKARMRTQPVIEVEVLAERRAGLSDRVVGLEIHLLIFVETFLIHTGQTAFANASYGIDARLACWLLMCQDRMAAIASRSRTSSCRRCWACSERA